MMEVRSRKGFRTHENRKPFHLNHAKGDWPAGNQKDHAAELFGWSVEETLVPKVKTTVARQPEWVLVGARRQRRKHVSQWRTAERRTEDGGSQRFQTEEEQEISELTDPDGASMLS